MISHCTNNARRFQMPSYCKNNTVTFQKPFCCTNNAPLILTRLFITQSTHAGLRCRVCEEITKRCFRSLLVVQILPFNFRRSDCFGCRLLVEVQPCFESFFVLHTTHVYFRAIFIVQKGLPVSEIFFL